MQVFFFKLWAHECLHVLKYHLIEIIDRELFELMLTGRYGVVKEKREIDCSLSLSEIATFTTTYRIEVLEMAKGFSFVDWHDYIKNKILMQAVLKVIPSFPLLWHIDHQLIL